MSVARVVGPRIEIAQAKALLEAGDAAVLDSVASHIWPSMSRTIQGAIRIPPEEIKSRFQELPRDKTIIVYCT